MMISSAECIMTAAKLEQCPAGQKPEVALAGRSNVGKSSLLNTLANRKNLAYTSKTPGRTQTINFYLFNGCFFLVDLPGYGFAKVPHKVMKHWGRLVNGYLSREKQLCGLIQLVDIRHAPTPLDVELCEWVRYHGVPTLIVATKADKVSYSQGLRQLQIIQETLRLPDDVPFIPFSAKTRQGKSEIWQVIDKWVGSSAI